MKGSAKRQDSSKTASVERENVSHCDARREHVGILVMTQSGADLLSEEDIIVCPVLAQGKALPEATILVGLSEQPGSIHKILAYGIITAGQLGRTGYMRIEWMYRGSI